MRYLAPLLAVVLFASPVYAQQAQSVPANACAKAQAQSYGWYYTTMIANTCKVPIVVTELQLRDCHLVAFCPEGGSAVAWTQDPGIVISPESTVSGGDDAILPDVVNSNLTTDQAFAQMSFRLVATANYQPDSDAISAPAPQASASVQIPSQVPLNSTVRRASSGSVSRSGSGSGSIIVKRK